MLAKTSSNVMQASPPPGVEDYLERNHVAHVSWHQTLNNHASTRPKQFGGKIVPSVTGCKTFSSKVDPGSAKLSWKCLLRLPHSFAAGDNLLSALNAKAKPKAKLLRMLVVKPLPT